MSTYNIPAITITEDASGKHAVIDYNYSGSELLALQPCLVRDPFIVKDPEANTHNVIRRRPHTFNVK